MDYGFAQNDMQFGDKVGAFNGDQEEEEQQQKQEGEHFYEEIQQQQREQEIGIAGNQRKHSRDPSSSAAGLVSLV